MELPRAELLSGERLALWCLAAFSVVTLTLVGVFALFLNGTLAERLDSLGTEAGFLIFGVLWAFTGYSTMRALQIAPLRYRGAIILDLKLIANAMHWGGMTGVYFLVVTFVGGGTIFTVYLAATGEFSGAIAIPGFVAVGALIGSLFAYLIGATVGTIFGLIGSVLMYVARRLGDALLPSLPAD